MRDLFLVIPTGFALLASTASAAPSYIAVGDSITFGETDLKYVVSSGDRGYVGRFADTLAGRNGGVRPTVFNFAIDGETSASLMSGSARVPPVVGRTDAILAAENLHYDPNNLVPQSSLFFSTVAAQKAAGNSVDTVSVTLGFNDLGALASLPPETALQAIPGALATYRANYTSFLTDLRQALPSTSLYLLGYYNPFPADPTSAAAPIFNAGGPQLNAIIRDLAGEFGGIYVDAAAPFLGHEAEYTYQDDMPHGSSVSDPFGGVLPIGNVHPNDLGYAVIADKVAAAPEPAATSVVMIAGAVSLLRRRRA